MKNGVRDNLKTFLFLVAVALLWQGYAQFVIANNNYFPSLWFVIQSTMAASDQVIDGAIVTATETTAGFFFGVTIGFVTGIVVSESYVLRRSLLPWVIFVYTVPAAIIAPLFLVWFGINLFAIGLFVSLLSFYPVFISTLTGFRSVEQEYYDLGEVTGASKWQMARHVKLWVALPHTFAGVRIAVQQSVVGAILAEFIASNTGLGFLIINSHQRLEIGLTFGTVLLLMVFAIIYFKIVSTILDVLKPVSDSAGTE